MTKDLVDPHERLMALVEQAARARRLAAAIRGDPSASQLEELAEELDAKIVQIARPEWLVREH
jgi:predicted methyltransferase MtxX (methanogen marker protein 4)